MKKLIMVFLSLILMISVCIPVNAANMITYTVYNEDGEIVEEGSFDPYSRKSWTTDVTLKSGYYMDFKNGSNAFYVANGATLRLTYSLNTSGTVACRF